jgi:hypothetical protein
VALLLLVSNWQTLCSRYFMRSPFKGFGLAVTQSILKPFQEIHRLLWEAKVHYHFHKSVPVDTNLIQLIAFHARTTNFFNINFNIILPSTPRSPKWRNIFKWFSLTIKQLVPHSVTSGGYHIWVMSVIMLGNACLKNINTLIARFSVRIFSLLDLYFAWVPGVGFVSVKCVFQSGYLTF